MKLKKPDFWDLKKPNFYSYLLIPFTLPIYLKNILSKNTVVESGKTKKICVGNIYIGGTGKTPLSIMISNIFINEGKKSVVIKKYYKNQLDEQRLIEKYANLICKKNRIKSVEEAKDKKFEYLIFDDGLQDSSVNYDLKIVCFNNNQWIGNGLLIPAGPLRETINSLKKYDAVIINGNNLKNNEINSIIKKANNKINIFESYYEPTNLNKFDIKKDYVVFSGIGNNNNFFNLLKKNNFKIIKKFNFPDHYKPMDNEINKIIKFSKENNAEIITTEKDFLRLDKKFQDKIKFLEVKIKMYNYNKFYNYIKKIL